MTHAPPVDWYSGWRTGWSKFWEATGLPVVAPHPERSEGLRIISETPEYPHSSVCVSWAVGWCLGLAAREGVIKADAASRAFSRTDQGLFKERSLDIQAMEEIKGGELAGVALKQPFAGLFLLASSNKGTLVGEAGFEPATT